jgi:hypothetical protein
MYSLSGRSLQLISDVSKRNKEMSKSTEADDFSDGKVQKTMKGIVDEIQRFKEQKSRQKQSRGKKMVSDDFLDVERLRNTMKVKRINDELLQHLESSLRWVIHYCRKHDIPLPEEDKIIDLCNKAIEIEKKLPKISDESLQGDKKTRTDDKFTEPNIERYIRF